MLPSMRCRCIDCCQIFMRFFSTFARYGYRVFRTTNKHNFQLFYLLVLPSLAVLLQVWEDGPHAAVSPVSPSRDVFLVVEAFLVSTQQIIFKQTAKVPRLHDQPLNIAFEVNLHVFLPVVIILQNYLERLPLFH